MHCTFLPLRIQTLSVWILLLCLWVITEQYVEMSEASHDACLFGKLKMKHEKSVLILFYFF